VAVGLPGHDQNKSSLEIQCLESSEVSSKNLLNPVNINGELYVCENVEGVPILKPYTPIIPGYNLEENPADYLTP